ncbi:hypothetical protein SERLA73DRAFT_156759 [Serpula lacrymans var. lacrymans S7.3]|uniref:ATP-dependent DNA helicase n=1 Tax=Serpula lacrymans var. lacrymans (strain S7.3) TaxID=936435 RepID=F8QFX1_SERL3|nr:hypothetical protein SERLA73DRAFT_156759 [Serpula lacrymans var. lacrymans S7.3]
MQFSKNAVPKELLSETKYSDDMETLEKGVKDVEAPGASSVVDIEEDEDTEVDNEEPAVIPLQALVVLDLYASGVQDNELLSSALKNISATDREHRLALRRGNQFINKYGQKDKHGKPSHVFGVIQKQQASDEEKKKRMITNLVASMLKKHLSIVKAKIMGTDESRVALRSCIWSMVLMKSPQYLWITINPLDYHDPIAQVFAGVDIDLNSFVNTAGPLSSRQSEIITGNPYAASKFFHSIVNTILEELFGIKVASKTESVKIQRREGTLGTVEGYVGTVEAQGRGMAIKTLKQLCQSPKQMLKKLWNVTCLLGKCYTQLIDRDSTAEHLNDRQKKAYTIVTDQLQSFLNGENPSQILMMVLGEARTGKTTLLKSIIQFFENHGASDHLAKTATSGIAASLLNGSTLHSWAKLPTRGTSKDN